MAAKLKFDEYDLGLVTTSGTAFSREIQVPNYYTFLSFIAYNSTGNPATAFVQISPDNGNTWVDIDTTISLTSGIFDKKEFDCPAAHIRMKVTSGGGAVNIRGTIAGFRDKNLNPVPQRNLTNTISLAAGSLTTELSIDRASRKVRIFGIWSTSGTGTFTAYATYDGVNYFQVLTGTLASGTPCVAASFSDHFFRLFRFTFTRTSGTFTAFAVIEALNEEE